MGLSLSDLAGCRSAISGMLPDTVTLYASDATTQVWQGPGRVDNDRSLTSRRDASDFVALVTPYGAPVAPGQVVTHLQGTGGVASLLWYVVVKVSTDTAYTLEEQAMLLALPYTLTVTRAVAPTTSDGQRRFDNYGAPLPGNGQTDADLVTTTTIHAAVSNDMDLRQNTSGAGPVRTTLMTLLTPLGSPIAEGDVVTVRGQDYRVTNLQTVDANGQDYAFQIELKTLI